MDVSMAMRESLRAISRNGMRSSLTCVGIVVGIASVILVPALGKCAKVAIARQFNSLGTKIIAIAPHQVHVGVVSTGAKEEGTLTAEDAEAVRSQLSDFVSEVTPVVEPATCQLIRGNRNWSSGVWGVNEAFPTIISHPVAIGRFFDAEDVRHSRRVCVIGTTVRDQLFGGGVNPVGETVRIGNMPFRVIGLLIQKGLDPFGQNRDDVVAVPYTTARAVLKGSASRSVGRILVLARRLDAIVPAERGIRSLLRARHRIRDGQLDDFMVQDAIFTVDMIMSVCRFLTILLSVTAAIALGVGGIGIMNIMLVSVVERVGEIGLRMALGAHSRDIFRQFLFEAVVLSSLGGLAGLLLGSGLSFTAGHFAGCSDPVDIPITLAAIAVSVAVGVFFGFYPAYGASRVDPIQCLRKAR